MMRNLLFRIFLILGITLVSAQCMHAEGFLHRLKEWVDSSDIKGCDTMYVHLPKEGFVAYLSSSPSWASSYIQAREPEGNIDMKLRSKIVNMWAVRLSYRGWGLSYSRAFKNRDDSEFAFSTYSRRYGLEIMINSSHDLKGTFKDYTTDPVRSGDYEGDSNLKSWLLNFYWAFNAKRFSLPAAMSHTTIQRRSAGSWLACINYVDNKLSVDPDRNLEPNYLVGASFKQINIGGGYAYNYVFGNEHCLLHVSAMPMVSVWHQNRSRTNDGNVSSISQQNISLSGVAHFSFVYNFSHYVTGLSGIYNLSHIYSGREDMSIYVNNLSATLFFGVRF